MLIDTHCHINSKEYFETPENEIKKALEEDVLKLIVVGFDKETNKCALELKEKYDNIYPTVGLHPSETDNYSNVDLVELENYLINNKSIVAVGECGLDFYYGKDNKEKQIELFEAQIKLAKKYDLPLIIHMRDATETMLNVLKNNYTKPYKGVMHCYSGSKEAMFEFVKLGFYISLGGPVTFKNAVTPKEVAKVIPNDRILVETDSPFLSPMPFRGKKNEPANVKYVAMEIAKLKDMSFEELADITTNNACKLFNI